MDVALDPTLLLLLAMGLDVALGELPNALHPVAWLGSFVGFVRARLPHSPAAPALLAGALLLVSALAWVALLVFALGSLARSHAWLAAALALYLLQASFACRALLDAGARVEADLRADRLAAARVGLTSLCSRDASNLDNAQVAGAATASLAENLSDSVVAPLFYFVLFGLPGALAFRVINTLDAMVGYRGKYEWLGKASARTDDLAGLLPARLTALLLLLAGALLRRPLGQGARVALRDARQTPSPNGGVVMALASGLLGARLEKAGSYVLGPELAEPSADTLRRARTLVGLAAALACGAALALTAAPGLPLWTLGATP
ncbi:MAG: cobalamin biosynthesis protein CobD [Myxococcales bacterium]|nr:cobalamin biosynthesis protein CobD [Myxococcales bacterium]